MLFMCGGFDPEINNNPSKAVKTLYIYIYICIQTHAHTHIYIWAFNWKWEKIKDSKIVQN